MTVIELRFPAGRFHATPWGRHVNEGAVEWPPSPWRIIRALIATWYLKARREDEISESTMRALVESLSEPAQFHLPRAVTAHTRHYMPFNEGKNEKTTKIFDTFIQIAEEAAVLVAWSVDLNSQQRAALQVLAPRLGYLGRAESLVEVNLVPGEKWPGPNSMPLAASEKLPEKTELVKVLVPMSPLAYAEWQTTFLATYKPPGGTKKKSSKKSKSEGPEKDEIVPSDLFAALHAETGLLQAAGWNLPPGATFVNYSRPANAFAPANRPKSRQKEFLPTVARYAVVSTVAPSVTQAVSVAERVHDGLCKWSKSDSNRANVFTGLDESGKPAADHQHAHIFCEANGGRDAITHITIWAPRGFDEAACLTLRRLNKVWGHGGHDIRLVLHGIGQPGDFADCKLLGAAKSWRSLTPFVSTRHAKTFRDGRPKMDASGWQIGSSAHDLLRLLALNNKGGEASVKQLNENQQPFQFGSQRLRSLQFQTTRPNGGGVRGAQSGNAFIITFNEPVIGPLALGYGAHFGLGLFVPVPEAK